MKVQRTHKNQRTGHTSSWEEAGPDASLKFEKSVNVIEYDKDYPKYVELSQDDEGDEYYHQTVLVDKDQAEKIIYFLKKEFDL